LYINVEKQLSLFEIVSCGGMNELRIGRDVEGINCGQI